MIKREVLTNGTICYSKDGDFHREDGPALEYVEGTKIWMKNGKIHRLCGPAVTFYNGTVNWYVNGKFIANIKSQEEFERYMRLLPFR